MMMPILQMCKCRHFTELRTSSVSQSGSIRKEGREAGERGPGSRHTGQNFHRGKLWRALTTNCTRQSPKLITNGISQSATLFCTAYSSTE